MAGWLFETERLAVRPKLLADVEALHAIYGDEEVMRHSGRAFRSLSETRKFTVAHIRHQEAHGYSMWSVVHRESGQVIGESGFLCYDEGVEVGWRLRRSEWGRGYGTEAVDACLRYGFTELDFDQVSAFVEMANRKALHVIEKLGMRLVKRSREGAARWVEYVAMPEFSR